MCINITISHSFSPRHEGVGSQEATQRVQGCLGDYHCIVKESNQKDHKASFFPVILSYRLLPVR